MNVCHFCGNTEFKHRTVQYRYRHDNKLLFVNNVPCVECTFCGEQYFEAKVLKQIQVDVELRLDSPLNVESVNLVITTEEILESIRESRE